MRPDVAYTRSGDVLIAYQTAGQGALDIVVAHGWAWPFDAGWDSPYVARFYRRIAARSRLILFDGGALACPTTSSRAICLTSRRGWTT